MDSFYRVLGSRHWVFTGALSVERIKRVVEEHGQDPVAAEKALIAIQSEDLEFWVRRLANRPGMRERSHLLEVALQDYRAGRFTGMIHIVISAMDGYVNDVTRQDGRRRGLHAQSGEDMEAWDSVVSHAEGLARIHEEVFKKPFYNTVTDEVTELYRNGIVHGTVINFGNPIVAAKAWNYLLAVADWAEAREKAAIEPEPRPTFRGLFNQLVELSENRRHTDAWEARTLRPGDHGFHDDEAHLRSDEFFELWKRRNWGNLAATTSRMFGGRQAATPRQVKEEYVSLTLNSWTIEEIRHEAAAVVMVEATVVVDDEPHRATLRWVHENNNGDVRAETQDGEWRLAWWGPAAFMDRSDTA